MSARPQSCPECGCLLTKPRSPADHRRFFSAIAKAFMHWPEGHEFQPDSPEHLRAYLLTEAGHAETTPIFVELDCFQEAEKTAALKLVRLAVEAALAAARNDGSYAFARVVGDTIIVSKPKSIAFHALSQREFGPLRDQVEAVIEAALGVKIETLLRQEAA